MSELMEVFAAYKELSVTDRIVFYTTLSNNVNVKEDNLQDFLIETRIADGNTCIYCEGSRVVKNGKRKDGIQRFLCRDCKKSFIPSSCSITSGTRKDLSVWAKYLKCMSDKKTLKETAEECSISVTTAFYWRHKILDVLKEVTDRVCLDGIVEADETFFNVSYKGNHKKSRQFKMPRKAHKRGNGITYGIQRVNAYHNSLKNFITRFHGVSTKHLEHYIIWNNLISNNRRNQKENISLMFIQILSRRLTVHNSDISARPPLSFIT